MLAVPAHADTQLEVRGHPAASAVPALCDATSPAVIPDHCGYQYIVEQSVCVCVCVCVFKLLCSTREWV